MSKDIKRYLKPSYLCESGSSEIKELAKKIIGKKKGEAAIRTIFDWVRDNIKYDISMKLVGAKKLIERKPMEGMCFDKTNLFIALCRSIDIPARYLQLKCKLKVKKDDIPADAFHLVAEVYADNKWIIADPSFDKEISNIIETSEFGKPTWVKVYSEKRFASLSRIMPFLVNNFILRFSSKIKKVRKAIYEARTELYKK